MIAVVILWLAVWRHPPGVGLDLLPAPDAPEYFAGAVNLAGSGECSIHLAGERFPPRYPPGFSVSMLPWIAAGLDAIQAPFAANGLAAFALLALVFAALWLRGQRLAAGLAAVVLVTTPAFIVLARSPMADLTGSLLLAASAGALLCYSAGGRFAWGVAGALVLGVAVTVRTGNALFAPLLIAAWSLHGEPDLGRLVRHGVLLATAVVVGALPLLVYNVAAFGNPLASGYAVWVPDRSTLLGSFELDSLVANLRYLARDVLQLEWKRTVATDYGHGSYLGPALVVLAALCVTLRPPRGRLLWMSTALLSYGFVMLFYFFQDGRFFLPLLAPVVVFVAVRISQLLLTARPALRLTIATLLGLHVLGIPGSGSLADVPRFVLEPPPAAAPRYELLQWLRAEPPGLLVSAFSVPYTHAVLGNGWTVCPAIDDHGYQYNPATFRFGAAERRALIEASVAAGRPVHLVAAVDFERIISAMTCPPGWAWQVIHAAGPGGIARLHRP